MNRLDIARQSMVLRETYSERTLQPLVWTVLLAAICVLALLLAFRQVVLQNMQGSEARHRATVAHAEAAWRCNALGSIERRVCRAQLDAAEATAALAGDRSAAVTINVTEPGREAAFSARP